MAYPLPASILTVLLAALLLPCCKAGPDDHQKYCARLTELEAGRPLPKELRQSKPADRLDHSTFAAIAVRELDAPSTTGARWLQALSATSPSFHREMLEQSAKEAGKSFQCPAFDAWMKWYDAKLRVALADSVREELGVFCKEFEARADAGASGDGSRGWEAAHATRESSHSSTAQTLDEAMAGKSPKEQLVVLQKTAAEHGVAFDCESFRTWANRAAEIDQQRLPRAP